ncbi:unnamed protein product [Cuscuta campestris]|uniref:Uncharacterized protein n=1 Tax=Cuscuta campestris TaxID=132261 RepID=A0A484NC97_9ASTE|nr:unnamed protein product [Cuscuta campestris]
MAGRRSTKRLRTRDMIGKSSNNQEERHVSSFIFPEGSLGYVIPIMAIMHKFSVDITKDVQIMMDHTWNIDVARFNGSNVPEPSLIKKKVVTKLVPMKKNQKGNQPSRQPRR